MARPHEELRADDWAGEIGARWLANLDRFESMNAAIGRELLARAAYRAGESVVDVGCGGGETTRSIGRLVAPGRVLGLDISPVLVDEARRRAVAAAATNVEFLAADAATVVLPQAGFDRLFSRFGIMFFVEPAAAFANLCRMLRPGGRADFAVWAPPAHNPWMSEVVAILRRHLTLPAPVPHAPGPFALDDPGYFGGLLAAAGFVDVAIEPFDSVVHVGGAGCDASAAATFVLGTMTFADAFRELPDATQRSVVDDVTAVFAAHLTTHGVAMPARTFLVRGVRGAAG